MNIKALGHSRRVTEGYTIRDLICSGGPAPAGPPGLHRWLQDRLQGTYRRDGNGHDPAQRDRFQEKDIVTFLKQQPQEINLGKVDQTRFLVLVLLNRLELREASPLPSAQLCG